MLMDKDQLANALSGDMDLAAETGRLRGSRETCCGCLRLVLYGYIPSSLCFKRRSCGTIPAL